MKKCKVTLAPAAKQRFFYLSPDVETLYFLAARANKRSLASALKTHPDIEIVSLKPGQWIEAEWNGCQNVHDEGETLRLSFVRLIKAANFSPDEPGTLLSVHFGWMYTDHLRFTSHRKNGMKVKVLVPEEEQFDFSELFQDNETIEDMILNTRSIVAN